MIRTEKFVAALIADPVLTGFAQQAVQKIQEPVVLPGTLVTISIPDLHKTMDAANEFVAGVSPQEMDLKAMLGSAIGDPELGIVPQGKGVVVGVVPGGRFFVGVEAAQDKVEQLEAMVSTMGMKSASQNDLFLVANDAVGLADGKALAAKARSTVLKVEGAGAYISFAPEKLMERFGPQIDMMLPMMTQMNQAGVESQPSTVAPDVLAKFLEGEVRVFVSLCKQISSMDIHLLPSKDKVVVSKTLVAKPGTPLHKAMTSPYTEKADPTVHAGLFEDGMIKAEWFVGNGDALMEFFATETDKLLAVMEIEEKTLADYNKVMAGWGSFFRGSGAQMIDVDRKHGFSMGYVLSGTNSKDGERLFAEMKDNAGLIQSLYDKMGAPIHLSVSMNKSRHANTSIHHMDFNYKLDKMEPQAAELIKNMGMDQYSFKLALAGNRMLWSAGSQAMEDLIDGLGTQQSKDQILNARKLLPAGGMCYYDFSPSSYLTFIADAMPKELDESGADIAGMKAAGEALKNTTPLMGAGYHEGAKSKWVFAVPTDFVAAIVKMAMDQ